MLGTYFLIQYLQDIGRSDLLYTLFQPDDISGVGLHALAGRDHILGAMERLLLPDPLLLHQPRQAGFTRVWPASGPTRRPGFKKIIIKPAVVGDLTWVKASYRSIHGRIISNWRREGDQLSMDITIPANTTATVFVPARDAVGVTESGKPAAQADGVKFLRMEKHVAEYAIGCGTYRFQSTLPETID